MDQSTIVIIFIVITIITIYIANNRNRDYYGQDASIRTSSGWIAGPNYGYDPITQFADQIEEMKKSKAQNRPYNPYFQ